MTFRREKKGPFDFSAVPTKDTTCIRRYVVSGYVLLE